MLIRASLLAAVLAASLEAQATPPSRATIARQVDSLMKNFVASGPGASVAIALVRGKDTLVKSATGFANMEARRPADASTIYRIGSVTKQFTAAIIMKLAEQRRLSIDDSLGKHLASIPAAWRPIPIRRLLNHTSGINNYTNVPAWQPTWSQDLTPTQIVNFVAADSLRFAPGTRFEYSNTGYVLLGMIIEKITGQSYANVVQEMLFKPLGMTRSLYCPSSPTAESGIATGYTVGPNGIVPAPYLSMTHPHAAGALCSTVGDLVLWQRALAGGRVVSPQSYSAMITPERLPGATQSGYGFGLGVAVINGHTNITHGGGVHGFVSSSMYFPDDSLNIVILSNSPSPAYPRLEQAIVRTALGIAVRPPLVPLPVADRDRFAGTYDLQIPGRVLPFRIFVRDSLLMAQAEGQAANPLLYLGNKVFTMEFDLSIRVTFVEENGEIARLTLLQNNATVTAPRRR